MRAAEKLTQRYCKVTVAAARASAIQSASRSTSPLVDPYEGSWSSSTTPVPPQGSGPSALLSSARRSKFQGAVLRATQASRAGTVSKSDFMSV